LDSRLDQAARLIETERAQIGHEIHDALLPLIFAASASLGALTDQSAEQLDDGDRLDGDRTRQRLVQIASWLDEALQTGRQLLCGVYPPEWNSAGWTAAAISCVDRLLPDQHAAVHWQLDPALNQWDPNAALAGYRIVVEAIRNAVRHGEASKVEVRSAQDADHWSIEVVDNGSGFDSKSVPDDRFGIRSMIGRAELVGGTLQVDSQPGGPTTVRFRLPKP
jgi:signal transduction histidine kinase